MKKTITLLSCLAIAVSISAQNMVKQGDQVAKNNRELKLQSAEPVAGMAVDREIITRGGDVQAIGDNPNAYSCAFGPKTYVWYDPGTDAIVFMHRSNYTDNGDLSNGALRYDVSKDKGQTWSSNVGPVWNPPNVQGAIPGMARYPQAIVYNPTSNTDPNNAYVSFFAPTLSGTNEPNSWGGRVTGSHKLDNSSAAVTNEAQSDTLNDFYYTIMDDFHYNHTTQKTFGVELMSSVGASTSVFQDTIIFSIGTWNSTTKAFDYVDTLIPFEAGKDSVDGTTHLADAKLAFADNGMTGYITVAGYMDDPNAIYGTYQPIVLKTTDGGATWSSPQVVSLGVLSLNYTDVIPNDSIPANGGNGFIKTTGFEHDLVVDANGNPHIIANIGLGTGAWSILSAEGNHGVYDIYSLDGGSTWNAGLIGYPETFRGEFSDGGSGVVPEDNRPQGSRTEDGNYIIGSYFSSDIQFTDNLAPDMFVRGYNVTTDTWDIPGQMVSDNTDAQESVTFGNVSYFMFYDATEQVYVIPTTYQELLNNVATPTQLYYFGATYYPLGVGIDDPATPHADIYPNPTNGQVIATIEGNGTATVTVLNTVGQVEYTSVEVVNGKSNVDIDLSGFATGIHFINIRMNGAQITEKVIKF